MLKTSNTILSTNIVVGGAEMNLGVTLARGGSKSIPKKNIVQLAGKPLLAYTIEAAKRSKMIDSYIVNTDCEEIAAVAESFGAFVQFGRPSELSLDTASSGATLKYAVERFEYETNLKVDLVVELMATNPLKTEVDIDSCVNLMSEKSADSVIAVGRLYDHHPSRIKYLSDDGVILDFYPEVPESRRQDLTPLAYIRAGSVYAMTRDQIATGLRYGGERSYGYVLPDDRFINIDEPRDLMLAAKILSET